MTLLFNELYGTYYSTVAEILKLAVGGELTEAGLKETVREKAFGESTAVIPDALKSGKWQLITDNLKTPLKNQPQTPMTELQKRWLKSVSLDPRVKLFGVDFSGLEDVKPLFAPDTVYYFDKYSDGDDFTDEGYINRFKTILQAVKERHLLKLEIKDRKGKSVIARIIPEYLEYSEKDDKFRLITSGCRYRKVIKLSSIVRCNPYYGDIINPSARVVTRKTQVTFTLFDGRNTLERAMLHFAHFEKTVEKNDDNSYTVRIVYDPDDETELLIRVLSFGPFIKVTQPQSFVNLIKERLIKQKRCGIM